MPFISPLTPVPQPRATQSLMHNAHHVGYKYLQCFGLLFYETGCTVDLYSYQCQKVTLYLLGGIAV